MRWMVVAWCLFVTTFSVTGANAENVWPQFRGPDGQGHSSATGLPVRWSESENVVWKTPIAGQGWSSPVVADGKAWLTSATKVKASAEEKAAKTAGSMVADSLNVARTITLWANEVDLASGKVLRKIRLLEVESPQPIHALNSYASPTPVLSEGRLYCHFGDYGTACLDTQSGNIIWKNRISLDHGVGPGSSPFVFEDLLILVCDGKDKQYILALNTANGETVWRQERPPIRSDEPEFRKAFASPLLIEFAGKKQIVIPGAQWCVSYEPRTGKEIWRVDHGRGFSNVPSPTFDGEHVFLCTGFMSQELWAIRPDGRGDITETHVTWKNKKQIPTMPSPVVFGDHVYTISDAGIAQCFAVKSGKLLWKERIGGKYSASPLFADGRIYLCSHEGLTTVFAAGEKYEQLAQNKLDGQLMASPVPAESDLLLRTDTHLYRIRK